MDPSPGLRLLGLSVSTLVAGPARQLSLGEVPEVGWVEAWRAVDQVRSRFGDTALGPATLLEGEGLRLKRRADQQWGPSEGPVAGQ